MPFPEYGGAGDRSDPSPPAELYELAARFSTDRPARHAYIRAQATVFRTPCDVSVFRFLLDRAAHVVIVGALPPAELDRDLRRILSTGEPSQFPAEILRVLWARRVQANREGPWVERHYRPGRLL